MFGGIVLYPTKVAYSLEAVFLMLDTGVEEI